MSSTQEKTSSSSNLSFVPGDRVRRKDVKGPIGTVQSVRTETATSAIGSGNAKESESPTETITVMWDNGTLSHFIPEGLEKN